MDSYALRYERCLQLQHKTYEVEDYHKTNMQSLICYATNEYQNNWNGFTKTNQNTHTHFDNHPMPKI